VTVPFRSCPRYARAPIREEGSSAASRRPSNSCWDPWTGQRSGEAKQPGLGRVPGRRGWDTCPWLDSLFGFGPRRARRTEEKGEKRSAVRYRRTRTAIRFIFFSEIHCRGPPAAPRGHERPGKAARVEREVAA